MNKYFFYHVITITILFLIFSFSFLQAQIPNDGFEKWDKGSPAGWWMNNKSVLHFLPVERTADAHSGKYAVKGTVKPMGNAMSSAPVIYTGSLKNKKFTISRRYPGISGYYKLKPVKDDQFVASVMMFKNGRQIGRGIKYFQAAKRYTRFKVEVKYKSKSVPDKCELLFTIYPSFGSEDKMQVHKGSVMFLDDLSFMK